MQSVKSASLFSVSDENLVGGQEAIVYPGLIYFEYIAGSYVWRSRGCDRFGRQSATQSASTLSRSPVITVKLMLRRFLNLLNQPVDGLKSVSSSLSAIRRALSASSVRLQG